MESIDDAHSDSTPRDAATERDVEELLHALKKAVKDSQHAIAAALLRQLAAVRVRKTLLKKTGAGLYIAGLMRTGEPQLRSLAARVKSNWMRDIAAAPRTPSATAPQSDDQDKCVSAKQDQSPLQSNLQCSRLPPAIDVGSKDVEQEVSPAEPSAVTEPATPAVERSFESDGLARKQSIGNPTRDKCVRMMYDALCVSTACTANQILGVAESVENALFTKCSGEIGDDYRKDVRSVCLGLRNKLNGPLRDSVLTGEIAPACLVRMTAAELAPTELRRQMEQLREANMFLARAAGNIKAETDQFKCGKCRKRRASYFQLQTRSADEPMTTFVECLECGHHWKF